MTKRCRSGDGGSSAANDPPLLAADSKKSGSPKTQAPERGMDAVERRRVALEVGVLLRTSSLELLRDLVVRDPEASVRRAAAWSLGRFRRTEDLDVLVEALGDVSPAVRAVAGWALWRLGRDACERLKVAIRSDPRPGLRSGAKAVLARIERLDQVVPASPTSVQSVDPFEPDGVWVERAVHDVLNIVQAVVAELDGLGEDLEAQGGTGIVPAALVERVRSAEDASKFLLTVGGSLLDAGRLEAGGESIQVETFDLVELVREAAHRGRPYGERDRVRVLAPTEPVEVRTDRTRLLRVLLNLVWNACKHSNSTYPVQVVVRQKGEETVVEVRDRGPGIPDSERQRVLEVFRTGTRTVGTGWGLGLSTAVRLMRQIGGALEIQERRPSGATIRLLLPRDVTTGIVHAPLASESKA